MRLVAQLDWQQFVSRHLESQGWCVEPPSRGTVSATKIGNDDNVKLRAFINCLDWLPEGTAKALAARIELNVVDVEGFLGSQGLNSGVSLLVHLGGQSTDPAFKSYYFQLASGGSYEAGPLRFLELFDAQLGGLVSGPFRSSSVFENLTPPIRLPLKGSTTEMHWGIRRLAYLILLQRYQEAEQQRQHIEKMFVKFRALPEPVDPLEKTLRAIEAKSFATIERALPSLMRHSPN